MKFQLNDFLYQQISLGKHFKIRVLDCLFLLFVTVLAFILRYKLFYFQSEDYLQNLQHWYNIVKSNGGISGIGTLVGNYTPPYTYLLALLTYLPFSSLVSIKLSSVACDWLLALVIGLIIYKMTSNKRRALFGYVFVMFAPTVIVNSALWAQCDSVIMLFLALCVYFIMLEKPALSTIMFAVALSIKIQSIFLFPVFLVLWVSKKISFRHLLLIPVVYALSVVPTAMAGGDYFAALSVAYYQVTTTASNLSFNCANLWAPISTVVSAGLSSAATMFALGVTCTTAYAIIAKPFKYSNELGLLCFLFFSLLIPFVLPHMHERYYYYAEILAIVYAMMNIKKIFVPVAIMFVSISSYLPFLFLTEPFSLSLLSIIIFVVIVYLSKDLYYLVKQARLEYISN